MFYCYYHFLSVLAQALTDRLLLESLETVSLFRSLGLFPVFWPILAMLESRWTPPDWFPALQPPLPKFEDRSKCTNYNWYHSLLHIPLLFQFFSNDQILVSLVVFFGVPKQQNPRVDSSFFFFLWLLLDQVCNSKSQNILSVSLSRTNFGLCIYHLGE